jgi:hypothetical protein
MTTQPVDGLPIHVSKCVYIDGQHVYAGPDCPHTRTEDEQGDIPPTGWTVQQ